MCTCKTGFALTLDQTQCVNLQNCGPNAVADKNGCKCAEGYYQTLAATCELLQGEYEDPCGENQYLDSNNVCRCGPDATLTIDKLSCTPKTDGAKCGENAELGASGSCVCKSGFVRSLDERSCLEERAQGQ